LAGLNKKKKKLIREVLQELKEEQFDDRTQEKGSALTRPRKENLPLWQQ
jgi:ribosomal protein L29